MPIRNLLTDPPGLPLVGPSILSADFARLGDECRAVLDASADLLHIDVMDGHFVPNLTMGPALCASLHGALPSAFLDVHLMVTNPRQFVEPFASAGANHVTFHIEVEPDPVPLITEVRERGMTAGIAINPETDIETLLPYVESPDMILIMSVHPGFSGQSFIVNSLDKVRAIQPMLRESQRLEMDGGINPDTAAQCRDAGCDVLVAASSIFGSIDYGRVIERLRGTQHAAC